MPSQQAPVSAVAAEQSVVTAMYQRLDELTVRAEREIARVQRAPTAGTPAAQVEREAMLVTYQERLSALTAAERRLCFGRLDLVDAGSPLYIGRLSLADERQRLMLTDWRAPAAEPFYRATSADPMGVTRRRHILLEGRTVSAVEDDVLDLASAESGQFEGDGALMAALAARRTGRMGDIVATIQAEQDRIIRAPLGGVLVVDGGPGCGKTVVGLHRAAYLLYTHRDKIARSGVLVVGPNALFLRYISQVLPGLGESSAVLATPGQLFPGVEAVAEPQDAVAVLKGDLRMVDVVATAVRQRQRVPDRNRALVVAGTRVTMTPGMVVSARDRARASRKPHNQARRTFVLSLLDRLARELAKARRVDVEANREILIADLRDSPDVRREVNLCWMPVAPRQLVADLWADPQRLAAAAPRLTAPERDLLARPRDAAWTVPDVPLLDEAAELLGEDDEAARVASAVAASDRAREQEYARAVLEMTGTTGFTELTAGVLAERYAGSGPGRRSVVDAALADRGWTYGHVVVDEAQELSAMQWRLLVRRCPSRSMTVVGDLAQAGSVAAPDTWDQVFDRVAPDRWAVEHLTVNYRTPEPLMRLAADVLRASGSPVVAPTSARDGEEPRIVRVESQNASSANDLPAKAAAVAAELTGWLHEPGRAAVIVAPSQPEAMAAELSAALPPGSLAAGSGVLDARVSLLTVAQAKGLEFDEVVVVEPADFLAEAPRGNHDLYVALTRATSRLTVVHARPLPPGFPSSADPREPGA